MKKRDREKKPASVSEAKKTDIKITPAKGRPMLNWVGKKPLSYVTSFPAQHIEVFDPTGDKLLDSGIWKDWPSVYPKGGLLLHGDNKEVLAHLLANGFRGKINLIYIDPPFDSGADYVRKVTLRGPQGAAKITGESYTLGEQIQYTDIWANDNYLQFMYERFLLMKEILSDDGVIFVHTNHERVHYIRCILDEVFGGENFRNDIVWKRGPGKSHPEYFGRVKDTILFYCKGQKYTWNKQFKDVSVEYKKTFRKKDERGYYVTQPLHSGKPAKHVPAWRGIRPPGGRGWAYKIESLDEFDRQGLVEWSKEGVPRLKRYIDEVAGAAIQDVWDDIVESSSPEFLQAFYDFIDQEEYADELDIWDDISPVLDRSLDHTGYPTQKPTGLAERMINACTNEGDIVLDCFSGSAPTLVAAQKLGRRWIGSDINKGAIQTTAKRLQTIIGEQIKDSEKRKSGNVQQKLLETDEDEKDLPINPAQSSFTVWRVNDYDLSIQHNEAVNLACEHIGVQRTRTDIYFDGTRGKNLVKIIPFGHPLTPLDLEEMKRELDARPDEDRSVTVVCLGMELSAKAWIDDWNRLRKGKATANRIEVIELRSDQKYGKFLMHSPAKARVKINRVKDKITINIEDFISPTIIERLEQQAGILKPKIDDWRAMVDCVMIDTAYDGRVFNIILSDVPEKKTDFVSGNYELPSLGSETTVAVKIIDMLGEEVLVIKNI